jgi:hypothetical protein
LWRRPWRSPRRQREPFRYRPSPGPLLPVSPVTRIVRSRHDTPDFFSAGTCGCALPESAGAMSSLLARDQRSKRWPTDMVLTDFKGRVALGTPGTCDIRTCGHCSARCLPVVGPRFRRCSCAMDMEKGSPHVLTSPWHSNGSNKVPPWVPFHFSRQYVGLLCLWIAGTRKPSCV